MTLIRWHVRWTVRLIARWWPLGYLGLCGFDIAGAWQSHWPHDAKIQTTVILGTLAAWFVLWRAERTMRKIAELRLALAEPSRCPDCHHYACDGDLCESCPAGNCLDKIARSQWLN